MKQRSDVEAQTRPIQETSPQFSGFDTEPFLETQTGNTSVQCLNDSQKKQPEIQETKTDMTTSYSGDDNISFPEITTSQIEGKLMRVDTTNEMYMPLSFTIVLKWKKEMLYDPLNF